MTKKESERIDRVEAILLKLSEQLLETDKQSVKSATVKKSNKDTTKDVEKVNEAICKILNKTSMTPNGFEEIHRFGKKTSISLMPESRGNRAYVDGTRAIYMTVSIENTRDGWENFMAIMEDLHSKFESHNAFYKQVKIKN